MKTKDATPLLAKLVKLRAEIDQVFQPEFDSGFNQLGLILSENLRNGGYWCTPENSVSFGGTGGDGVHFSLLLIDGQVSDLCPVIMTVPALSRDIQNLCIGENLSDFIRFGLNQGFFRMEELSYLGESALDSFSFSGLSSQKRDGFDELSEDALNRKMLDYIGNTLDLLPLSYSLQRFRDLQEKYLSMIRYPDDYYQKTKKKNPNENHRMI